MQIHEIITERKKSRKRVGRGGKRGTYSGRGNKGQKSRSGGNVDPLFEGGRSSLVERMKKNRGKKAFSPKKITVTLTKLEKSFENGEMVSLETLLAKKILSKKTFSFGAKVVATGSLTKKLIISGDILLSSSAQGAIEKLGGTVKEIGEKK
ncbi:MAG: 50S ribosomal protein L15 [Candidatus Moranbacteria bacterium]|nr:50S ribosomal protein L15 [Candidatus Moranbacteria bacterium]